MQNKRDLRLGDLDFNVLHYQLSEDRVHLLSQIYGLAGIESLSRDRDEDEDAKHHLTFVNVQTRKRMNRNSWNHTLQMLLELSLVQLGDAGQLHQDSSLLRTRKEFTAIQEAIGGIGTQHWLILDAVILQN